MAVHDYKYRKYLKNNLPIKPDYYCRYHEIDKAEKDFWIHYLSHELKSLSKTEKEKYYCTSDPELKQASYISIEDWRIFFKDTWNFPGIYQDEHDAMFPEELPKRLIRMYSFVGDTVLDPFLGSGTTTKVAADLGRNSIGFELGFNREKWKRIIKNKIESGERKFPALFNYYK